MTYAIRPPVPCGCGCGEDARPGRRYILGHNALGVKRPPRPRQLCACGCGYLAGKGIRTKFIPGHDPEDPKREVASTIQDQWKGYNHAHRYIPCADRCEKCGSDGDGWIDRHHIDGNQLNNDPSNIAFVCRQCHTEAHSRPDLYERCVNGHEWTPETTYYQARRNGKTSRRCRECHRVEQQRYLQRRRAA